jgi:hypothetical protein
MGKLVCGEKRVLRVCQEGEIEPTGNRRLGKLFFAKEAHHDQYGHHKPGRQVNEQPQGRPSHLICENGTVVQESPIERIGKADHQFQFVPFKIEAEGAKKHIRNHLPERNGNFMSRQKIHDAHDLKPLD